MATYDFSSDVPKTEINSTYAEVVAPEDPDGVQPFFEDHLDAIKKAVDVLSKVVGSSQSKISIVVSGNVTPGHCTDSEGGLERISIVLSVTEDVYLNPALVPPVGQTSTAGLELTDNALTTENPNPEPPEPEVDPEPEDVLDNTLPEPEVEKTEHKASRSSRKK